MKIYVKTATTTKKQTNKHNKQTIKMKNKNKTKKMIRKAKTNDEQKPKQAIINLSGMEAGSLWRVPQ